MSLNQEIKPIQKYLFTKFHLDGLIQNKIKKKNLITFLDNGIQTLQYQWKKCVDLWRNLKINFI